jgi:uncharacterized protein
MLSPKQKVYSCAIPGLRRIDHLPIVMDDGVVLSAAVILPASGRPVPAILDAVPYRKDDDFRWLDWSTYAYLAARGFACVRLDLRGTGSSTGVLEDEYSARELDDLEAAIAAIAGQSWCSGRVGMTGVSWGGFNTVQVAMRRPPALAAIAPIHFTVDRYRNDVHYVGGSLQVRESGDWPGSMVAENGLPPVPALVGDDFERIWRDRLERTPQWTFSWLRHQRRDAYWRHGSLCEDWAAITCPILAIGGWLDGYVEACLAVLEHCTPPRRAVIGPWAHTRPHLGWPGPAIDHRELMAQWFERWLADVDNGADREPQLIAYLRDGMPREPYPEAVAGGWRAFASATPRRDRRTLWSDPRTWRGPQWVGHGMPWWCPGHPPTGHSTDMRPDDAHSLTWDSEPLAEPLTLVGRPVARLRVSADQAAALVAVRLEQLFGDGHSALICRGSLNLTHRESDAAPEPLIPGETYDVQVALGATGVVIPAGDRVRVAVAGADWPIAWPPPARFALTVHEAAVDLPIAPLDASVAPPLPEPVEGPPNPHGPSTEHSTATVARDLGAGLVRLTTDTDSRTQLADGLTALMARVVCEVGSDDPLRCRVLAEHRAEVVHPGVSAVARSRLEITCDGERFHVGIRLDVDRDGAPFFSREWRDSLPRDHL